MGKKNILMLGPGEPGLQNSGLGVAVDNIAKYLSEKVNLQIIQPSQLEELNNGSKSKKVVVKSEAFSISDFELISEISKIQIDSLIPPYWYDTSAATSKKINTKSELSSIQKELEVYSAKATKAATNLNFDVIYAHDWITFEASLNIKRNHDKPLVLHVHSLDYDRNAFYSDSWVSKLEKEAFEAADVIICVSSYTKEIITNIYGISESKVFVVHNGHNIENTGIYNSPFSEKIVLFVGRLTGQKGPTKFLEIAEKVSARNPDTRFIMAGDGDMYKSIIEAGSQSPIANRFHITGHLNKSDLTKLYSMADIYCMPSVSEPFGLTAFEAAAANLPLVLSNNSGASEVLPGALVADNNDLDQFADHILTLLSDEAMVQKTTKTNQKSMLSLTWDHTGEKIFSILMKH